MKDKDIDDHKLHVMRMKKWIDTIEAELGVLKLSPSSKKDDDDDLLKELDDDEPMNEEDLDLEDEPTMHKPKASMKK